VLLASLVLAGLLAAGSLGPGGAPSVAMEDRSVPSPAPASPPVTNSYAVLADAFIEGLRPDRNYGAADALAAGGDPANGTAYRSLVQFDVGDIPSAAVILNATLSAYVTSAAAGTTIDAHRLRAPWNEGTGREFAYRVNLTVTETAGVSRLREPVDLLFTLPTPIATFASADFRLFDDLGDEVPSQVYGATYSGPNVTSVHVVFGATVPAGTARTYALYYGNVVPTIPSFRAGTLGTSLWNYPAGSRYAPLTAADLNGDGRLEVVFGSSDGGVYAIQWNGSLLWRYPALDVIDYLTSVADVDGDGALEVVFATSGAVDFQLYALSADGQTIEWSTGAIPTKAVDSAAAIADLDGDGIMEIFMGSTDRILYAINGSTGAERWRVTLGGANWAHGTAVGNVTEGPEPEVVLSTATGILYAIRADGSTAWSVQPGSNAMIVGPSLGDVDGDGDLDVISGDAANNGNMFAIRGTDGSTIWSVPTTSNQYGGQVLVDWEDDGLLETVFGMTRRNQIRSLDSTGATRWTYTTGGNTYGVPSAADVDLDGVEEILVGSFDNSLHVIDRNGNVVDQYFAPDAVSAPPIVADLDGDGTMEIVFASRSITYAYSTASLGHDFRTGGYNVGLTTRFLDGNSPDGAPLLNVTVGSVGSLGGSGVTWRTRDGSTAWASLGADFDAAIGGSATAAGSGEWLSWNVTGIVQTWTSQSQPNVGFLLKARNEAAAGVTTFGAREADPALDAVLEVTYFENTAPSIAPAVPDQVASEDGPLWQLDLAGFANDPDTPSSLLRWDLSGVDPSLYDYSGGNITGNQRLYFQPKPDAFGTDDVTLFLFDDTGNLDAQPLRITITPINDGPSWTQYIPTTLYVKYGLPYTFDFAPYAQDIDTPPSGLRVQTDTPAYASVNGFRVTFSYPANFGDQWDFIVLTVDDGALSDSESITVRLTTDTPPQLTQPLPDVILTEGESRTNEFDLDAYFDDADGDALFYSYGNTHVSVTIVNGSAQPREHQVDFAATGEWWGVESVTFQAKDPTGAIIEDTILVTVLPVNDPPVLASTPPWVVHYDEPYVFDLTPYVSDTDNDLSEITITTSLPSNVTVSGLVMTMLFPYTYSMFPLIQAPYTLPLTIFASDGLNTTFRVTTVTVGNDYPPRLRLGLQLPDVTFFEDEILADAFDLDDYFEDVDSSTIFYYSGPVDVQVIIRAPTHTVNFTAAPDWFGAELVTFRATDDGGAYAEDTTKVTVRPVNDAPYLRTLPVLNSKERTFFFNVRNYSVDVDNDLSELTVTTSNPHVTIQGFLLIFTYPDGVFEDTVNLTISDGTSSTTSTLAIAIERPNLLLSVLPWIIALAGIAAFVVATRYFRNTVEHVFLIYQGGTPLAHLSRTLTSDKDPDLIASMFTAIQSFMNESFHSMGVGSVRSIEMAEHHVAFGRGQYVLLVVLYGGRESNRLERRVEAVVKDIETRFTDVLANWNGDVDRMAGVKGMLERLWGAKDTGQAFRAMQGPVPTVQVDSFAKER
jgi:hypothetical protein